MFEQSPKCSMPQLLFVHAKFIFIKYRCTLYHFLIIQTYFNQMVAH